MQRVNERYGGKMPDNDDDLRLLYDLLQGFLVYTGQYRDAVPTKRWRLTLRLRVLSVRFVICINDRSRKREIGSWRGDIPEFVCATSSPE